MKENKSVSTKLMTTNISTKLIAVFVVLGVADAILTYSAISLGSHELNPIMNLGNLYLTKASLSVLVILALLRFRKAYLLKYVNIGMCVVVAYNALALWSWM